MDKNSDITIAINPQNTMDLLLVEKLKSSRTLSKIFAENIIKGLEKEKKKGE